MGGRPQVVTPAFYVIAVGLGFVLGIEASVLGYAVPIVAASVWTIGVVQLAESQRARGEWRIREALRRADLSIAKAAVWMELDHADLQRGLSGERKLDLWRLEMLPEVFWQEYWPLLAQDKGIPEQFHTFLRMFLPRESQERMA